MSSPRVTTNPADIDFDAVYRWLSEDAYWAIGRSRETFDRATNGSINFGVLDSRDVLIGYARVVTDHATFAWVCDVYVDPTVRGLGIGLFLAEAIVTRLRPIGLKRVLLSTLDAHGLYEKVGFERLPNPEKLMQLNQT